MTKEQFMALSAKRERFLHATVSAANPMISQYTHTHDAYYVYDGWQVSGDTSQIFEIKVRDYNLTYLLNYGARIEQQKFINLKSVKERTKQKNGVDAKILYYSFTSSGYVIYELPEDYNYDWKLKWCQKNDYSNEKELKWCCDLPQELVVEYKFMQLNTNLI